MGMFLLTHLHLVFVVVAAAAAAAVVVVVVDSQGRAEEPRCAGGPHLRQRGGDEEGRWY